MWVIFNPTENDLDYEINFQKWKLNAGEAKKFPNEIGREMLSIHGFLEILERDDLPPKRAYKKPKNIKTIGEATPEQMERDGRKITHPSSDPKVVESGGFSGRIDKMSDEASGLPKTYQQKVEGGKLISFDKDGVGWYGSGISVDNPLAKE